MKLHLNLPGTLVATMAALFAPLRSRIAPGSCIQTAGITIGKRSRIRHSTVLDARCGSISIGEGVWIGPGVTILTGDPDLLEASAELSIAPVTIGAGASIGAGAIILPGVRIGAGALIGVGSIVTRDVEGAAIVAGAPARIIGRCRQDGALEFAVSRSPTSAPADGKST